MVNGMEGGTPMSYGGLKDTEIPGGSPMTVAEGSSLSRALPTTVGVSVEVRVPPMPAVTLPSVEKSVKLVTASLDWGGGAEVVEEEVEVVEVVVLLLVVVVVVDVVEEAEPEGGSASPISTQG